MANAKARLALGAATGMVLAAATLVSATPASADATVCSDTKGSCAYFTSRGEKLVLRDKKSDGLGAYAKLGTKNAVVNTNGKGGAAVVRNYSFPEGTKLKLKVCNITSQKKKKHCNSKYVLA